MPHYLIYKPYRMLSQFITHDRHQRNKRFLGELADFPDGLMAVGRLDENSEGLLIVTNDGNLSYRINNSKKWEKEYYAQVDGIITPDTVEKLKTGAEISINGKPYQTKKCKAKIIAQPTLPETKQRIRDERHGPTSWVSITLTEGKFRQVRKMCAVVGFPVLRLVRVRIGSLDIETLDSKSVVELKENQLLADDNQ